MKRITLVLTVALVFSAMSMYAQTAQTRLDNGKRLFDQQNYDGAIQELNEAIRLNPNLAEAFAFRGMSYSSKGDKDRALSDANRSAILHLRFITDNKAWEGD
jgi:Flp pilus assembly protein TadD